MVLVPCNNKRKMAHTYKNVNIYNGIVQIQLQVLDMHTRMLDLPRLQVVEIKRPNYTL
jgi:hypothetical protein